MSYEPTDSGTPEQPAGEPAQKAYRTAEEMAAEAVRIAKLELEKAQKFYEDVRQKATEKIQDVREKKVGDLVDSTLEAVKKYPGATMLASVAVGFCMGRWIQKILGR